MRRGALSLTALAVALLALPATTRADSLEEIFDRANHAYFQGDYEGAADGYRELHGLGVVDPDVAFNLATAEARRGRYGTAIQHFERALWLRPGDEDAREGLASARAAVGARRANAQGEAEVDEGPPLGEALFGGLSRDLLALLTLLSSLALFGALTALLFVRRESVRLGLGIAAPLMGLVLLVSGAGMVIRNGWLEEGEPAVVLAERVPLREGPEAEASERHQAREGQRAWILDDGEDGWLLVRVPSVGEGWAQADAIGAVRP